MTEWRQGWQNLPTRCCLSLLCSRPSMLYNITCTGGGLTLPSHSGGEAGGVSVDCRAVSRGWVRHAALHCGQICLELDHGAKYHVLVYKVELSHLRHCGQSGYNYKLSPLIISILYFNPLAFGKLYHIFTRNSRAIYSN